MTRSECLVWMDLEMTGLNPIKDVILEVATLVTDVHLQVIAEAPVLVVHQPEAVLEKMEEVVRRMHERNGLLQRVRQSQLSAPEAEETILRFLRQHCAEGESPLCGNTVWTDRMFLSMQMPSIHRFLHHRVIDVSTLKELAQHWFPSIRQAAPPKPETHRALDDIKASIVELKYYREFLLVKPAAK